MASPPPRDSFLTSSNITYLFRLSPFIFPVVRSFVSCRQKTLGLNDDTAWLSDFSFDKAPLMFALSSLNLFVTLDFPLRPRLVTLVLFIDLFSCPPASWPDLKKEESFSRSSRGPAFQSWPREYWGWVLQPVEAEAEQVAEDVLQTVQADHG